MFLSTLTLPSKQADWVQPAAAEHPAAVEHAAAVSLGVAATLDAVAQVLAAETVAAGGERVAPMATTTMNQEDHSTQIGPHLQVHSNGFSQETMN